MQSYQKNKEAKEEVAIINNLGFFRFGKNNTLFYAISKKQIIFCEEKEKTDEVHEIPEFEVFYFGKLSKQYIINQETNASKKLWTLLNYIEEATPENYPNFIATLSAILCSLHRKELYAIKLKMGPLHYLGSKETGKSQMREYTQAVLPHVLSDGVVQADVTDNVTLTLAAERANQNSHPFFLDPSPDMADFATFYDCMYEGNQLMNARSKERSGLAPSQVFTVWDHEKRSLANFKPTLKESKTADLMDK